MEPKRDWRDTVAEKPRLAIAAVLAAMALAGASGYYLGARNAGPRAEVPVERTAAAPDGAKRQWQPLPERNFGDWRLMCLQNAKGMKRCELVLRAIAQKSHQLLAAVAVGQGPRGRTVLTVRTPPAVILPKGVNLKLGDTDLGGLAFVACTPRFCRAVQELDDKTATALGAADVAGIRYTVANGREIGFKVPAKGFAEGFAAWKAEQPAVTPAAPAAQ